MLAGGDEQAELMAADLCEGATLLAQRLHMPEAVVLAFIEHVLANGKPADQ